MPIRIEVKPPVRIEPDLYYANFAYPIARGRIGIHVAYKDYGNHFTVKVSNYMPLMAHETIVGLQEREFSICAFNESVMSEILSSIIAIIGPPALISDHTAYYFQSNFSDLKLSLGIDGKPVEQDDF